VINDVHAHLWPQCATFTKKGIHKRLLDAAVVLIRWGDWLKDKGIDVGFINGDLVHPRGFLYHQVYHVLRHAFQSIKQMGITLHAIPGNHDLDSEGRHHVWDAFSRWVTVHDRPEIIELGGVRVAVQPYLSEPLEVIQVARRLRKAHVLMGHMAIQNMPAHGGYIWGLEVPRDQLPPDPYYISGHYHQYKVVDEHFLYTGAPMQHTWGDEGESKGMWAFTLYDDLRPLPQVYTMLHGIPKFLTLPYDDPRVQTRAIDGNFVRLVIPRDVSPTDRRALVASIAGKARWVGVVSAPPGARAAGVSTPDQAQSVKSSVVTYVKQHVPVKQQKTYARQGWTYVKEAMRQS
jgi:hypothetical protein